MISMTYDQPSLKTTGYAGEELYSSSKKTTGYDFQGLKSMGVSGNRKGGIDTRTVSPKAHIYQQQFKQAFNKN